MSKFKDAFAQEWSIEFDGILLDEICEATGVDLADISAGGLAVIEQDAKKLVRVLCVACSDEIKQRGKSDRDFAKGVTGEALERALEAIVGAAANFFPPKIWSEVQSNSDQQREATNQWRALRPMLAQLNQPDMPPAMRDAVMAAVGEMIEGMDTTDLMTNTTSPPSEDEPSATGPDVTPPTLAPNVLENAGLTPAG